MRLCRYPSKKRLDSGKPNLWEVKEQEIARAAFFCPKLLVAIAKPTRSTQLIELSVGIIGSDSLVKLQTTYSSLFNSKQQPRSRKSTQIEMGGDAQPNAGATDQHPGSHGVSMTSYHPPNGASTLDMAQNPSPLANSVVRDLLRVYESLTQSSTPQVTIEDNAAKPNGQTIPGYGGQPPVPLHPYTAHPPTHGYSAPPPMYHLQAGNSYQGYYDSTYAHPPYMGAPTEQLGYMSQGHDSHGHMQPHTSEGDDYDDEAEDSQEGSGRPKRKRRGSDNSESANESSRGQRGRKKSKAADGRWSKRFTWPEDLHRDFVSAIFDVGLKHSSPSTILEHMPKHEQITTERIKSHLQKYRMHRVKSKKEFISSYDASLRDFQNHGVDNSKPVSGAAVAAQLTHEDMTNATTGNRPAMPREARDETAPPRNETLMLPQLTEAEKASPIGSSMGYLMGLFFSLKQQLMMQRAAEAAKAGNKPHTSAPVGVTPMAVSSAPGIASLPESGADHVTMDANAVKPASQSVRTNIEENSAMKREMQNQMALQNKMRALKQQELNKYKNLAGTSVPEKGNGGQAHAALSPEEDDEKVESTDHSLVQGAGELAGNDDGAGRLRGLSIGNTDEFWNTDVVDEQLFEFLMNN